MVDAYNLAMKDGGGNAISSEFFTAKDANDEKQQFKLSLSASPGKIMTISVSQDYV